VWRHASGAAFDSGVPLWQGARRFAFRSTGRKAAFQCFLENVTVVKPEWGTKRTCPKCGTRFYDLEKDNPVTCIECGAAWEPDPILKSKQPLPYDAPKKDIEVDKVDTDLSDDDLDIDEDAEQNPDDDVDLGGDDDIGVTTTGDDDDN
jgi:uncharacterized protein (TIGR02300 family)